MANGKAKAIQSQAEMHLEAEKRRDVEWRKLEQLLLDSRNPRLPDGYENAPQDKLLSTLAQDYRLTEVGQSIAANGYFAEEPLVTIKHPAQDKWIVVEGNRRLAALFLLAAPAKAPESVRETWGEIAAAAKHKVNEVPTLVYGERKEITPYLGFRHITGVLQWAPYQKGRYVAQLVEEMKLSFAEIARLIGNRPRTVREHYVSYTLVRQAREAFDIDTTRAEDLFGILRRALSDPNLRGYMSLDLDRNEQELAKPLNPAAAEKVKELFGWMFGTKEKAAVLRESRDLSMLGLALANDKSLAALKTSGDLTYAFELSGGEENRLIEYLSKASYQLDQSFPMVLRHRTSKEVIALVERCREVLEEIVKLISEAPKK